MFPLVDRNICLSTSHLHHTLLRLVGSSGFWMYSFGCFEKN